MGAWIEIKISNVIFNPVNVAPLVGAWIEIICANTEVSSVSVAPLVGAWIEMTGLQVENRGNGSLLSWERGLKFNQR